MGGLGNGQGDRWQPANLGLNCAHSQGQSQLQDPARTGKEGLERAWKPQLRRADRKWMDMVGGQARIDGATLCQSQLLVPRAWCEEVRTGVG